MWELFVAIASANAQSTAAFSGAVSIEKGTPNSMAAKNLHFTKGVTNIPPLYPNLGRIYGQGGMNTSEQPQIPALPIDNPTEVITSSSIPTLTSFPSPSLNPTPSQAPTPEPTQTITSPSIPSSTPFTSSTPIPSQAPTPEPTQSIYPHSTLSIEELQEEKAVIQPQQKLYSEKEENENTETKDVSNQPTSISKSKLAILSVEPESIPSDMRSTVFVNTNKKSQGLCFCKFGERIVSGLNYGNSTISCDSPRLKKGTVQLSFSYDRLKWSAPFEIAVSESPKVTSWMKSAVFGFCLVLVAFYIGRILLLRGRRWMKLRSIKTHSRRPLVFNEDSDNWDVVRRKRHENDGIL